eukprot:1152613-Pelagomonas_calceolata.AAC.8
MATISNFQQGNHPGAVATRNTYKAYWCQQRAKPTIRNGASRGQDLQNLQAQAGSKIYKSYWSKQEAKQHLQSLPAVSRGVDKSAL